MTISEKGLALIKSFEGLRLTAYPDSGGLATIGYGTIRYPNGIKVRLGDKITEQEALEYLHFEVNKKALAVQSLIKETPITQNMFDALVSFAYNLGSDALAKSTLLKKIKNNPHDPTIKDQFILWDHVGKVEVEGLKKRRIAEWEYYSG